MTLSGSNPLSSPGLHLRTTDFINMTIVKTSVRLCAFLDGPHEAGETYLVNFIPKFIKVRGKGVVVVPVSTGAAKLISGGRTAHLTFKAPVPCGSEYTCYIFVDSNDAQRLQKVSLII